MNQEKLLDVDWSKIPAPADDGATAHLVGMTIPPINLLATDDTVVTLSALAGRTVVSAIRAPANPAKRAGRRLGYDPRRARLHAADLRISRSSCRIESRGSGACIWLIHPKQRLPNRDGVAAAFTVSGFVG